MPSNRPISPALESSEPRPSESGSALGAGRTLAHARGSVSIACSLLTRRTSSTPRAAARRSCNRASPAHPWGGTRRRSSRNPGGGGRRPGRSIHRRATRGRIGAWESLVTVGGCFRTHPAGPDRPQLRRSRPARQARGTPIGTAHAAGRLRLVDHNHSRRLESSQSSRIGRMSPPSSPEVPPMDNLVKIGSLFLNLDQVLRVDDLFARTKEDRVIVYFSSGDEPLTLTGQDAD